MKNKELINQTHPMITADHLRRLAVVYVRQSTEEQVQNNTGSTDFQGSLTAVAQSYGWPDSQIEIIDEDLGKSGSSSERRTGWQRLQTEIAAKRVGAVFVANISRLSRQLHDFEVFRILAALHGTLLYTDGRLVDPGNPNDTIMSQITAMVAQFENRKRTEIMSQARKIKAKQGVAVSTLPVGWIKCPDGKFDYDPETKDIIRTIIDTFWQTRVLRRTVIALIKAGVQIPARHGHRISFIKPTFDRVRKIVVHPAYAGMYVYGRTEAQPGGRVMATGVLQRIKVPEERWIKIFNHHPAYMTLEQQEEIKAILKKNHFQCRDRAGRGPALLQGLFRCSRCNASLRVKYIGYRTYGYDCAWSVAPCTRFASYEFDRRIIAEVFKVLETPPLDMLRAALEETRSQERTRLDWIESERERLGHEERRARDRADLTLSSLPRVHFDALDKLEKVLEEKERFEQKIAIKLSVPKTDESDEDMEELCRLASEVPSLWDHPAVTHQERKEIVRCVIDHIVVAATKERIDATIFWKSGGQTLLSMWTVGGRSNLVRELHEQKLTTLEIQEHLAAGKTSTGQVVNLSLGRINFIQHKLGLRANRFSARNIPVGQTAAELTREGRSLEWIAQHFNEKGFASPRSKSWTPSMVYDLIARIGEKAETIGNIHRRVITEAHARGLSYRQMALEFNERNIRRKSSRPWTALIVANTCSTLNLLQRDLQKKSTNAELTEPIVVRKSA